MRQVAESEVVAKQFAEMENKNSRIPREKLLLFFIRIVIIELIVDVK